MSDAAYTPSEKVENFLKAVYTLQQNSGRVSTNTLSDVLQITAPSVTDMAQRLVTSGLVDYQKYYGVLLTPAGEEIALRVLRRHRLIELYLVRELGYELHEVHTEAEELEHAVSERFIEALAKKLGEPEFDPHGDPIPAADGTFSEALPLITLVDAPVPSYAKIAHINTSNPEMIQYLIDRGFRLDQSIQIIAQDPFEGPLTVCIEGEKRVIGYQAAECIGVLMLNEDEALYFNQCV